VKKPKKEGGLSERYAELTSNSFALRRSQAPNAKERRIPLHGARIVFKTSPAPRVTLTSTRGQSLSFTTGSEVEDTVWYLTLTLVLTLTLIGGRGCGVVPILYFAHTQ